MAAAWIDQLAADLLDLDAELRPLLRAMAYDAAAQAPGRARVSTAAAAADWRTVTVTAHEARALLRAAMPAPIAATRRRTPHARMVAALQLFAAHLLALSDAARDPAHAIAAATSLQDELRRWLDAARWSQACRAAGVRWSQPTGDRVAITALTQHQTPGKRERQENTAELHGLDAAPTPAAAPLDPARHLRRRRTAAAAQQAALDLPAAAEAGAQVVALKPAPAPPRAPPAPARRRPA